MFLAISNAWVECEPLILAWVECEPLILAWVECEPVRQSDCVKIRAKTFPGAPCEGLKILWNTSGCLVSGGHIHIHILLVKDIYRG